MEHGWHMGEDWEERTVETCAAKDEAESIGTPDDRDENKIPNRQGLQRELVIVLGRRVLFVDVDNCSYVPSQAEDQANCQTDAADKKVEKIGAFPARIVGPGVETLSKIQGIHSEL